MIGGSEFRKENHVSGFNSIEFSWSYEKRVVSTASEILKHLELEKRRWIHCLVQEIDYRTGWEGEEREDLTSNDPLPINRHHLTVVIGGLTSGNHVLGNHLVIIIK